MSDSISAYMDDVAEYEANCRLLKLDLVKGVRGLPDCYGEHAKQVADQARKLRAFRANLVRDLNLDNG